MYDNVIPLILKNTFGLGETFTGGVMAYLLPNVITRPDFIAYNHKHVHNISRKVCRCLGALSVAFTIKSQEEYEKVKQEYDLFIFDSFIL